MPHHKSAAKRMRQAKKRRLRNRMWKSKLKTFEKKFRTLISEKKIEEAKDFFKEVAALFEKASNKGIIHRNKAARKISRLHRLLNKVLSISTE